MTTEEPTQAPDSYSWSQKWSYWIRDRVSVSDQAPQWSDFCKEYTEHLRSLRSLERIRPRYQSSDFLDTDTLEKIYEDSDRAFRDHGWQHNGKWNARLSDHVADLLDSAGIVSELKTLTQETIEFPHGGTYIRYFNEGERLNFHLDDFSYGEANVLICLDHFHGYSEKLSSTLFLGPSGYESHTLEKGGALAFDGCFTPHGRTPLAAGETVTLLALAFRPVSAKHIDTNNLPEPPC